MKPTERMISRYHHLVDQMGEATNIIEYDVPMFSGCKMLLLGPALSEIALTPFPGSDSVVKVLHMYPLTDLETHMVAEHGREEFIEFVEKKKINLFSDRHD